MPKKIFLCVLFSFLSVLAGAREGFAHKGHGSPEAASEGNRAVVLPGHGSVRFLFERVDWDQIPVEEAAALVAEGHDIDDKMHEEFYFGTLELNPLDVLKLTAEIPYVSREFLELENETHIGEAETVEGFGDVNCLAEWEFFETPAGSLAVLGGVKFPVGTTREENSRGDRLPVDLQPGTGSFDYTFGADAEVSWNSVCFEASAGYVLKTEGALDFESGDVFNVTASLAWPATAWLETEIECEYEHADKDRDLGAANQDSGGDTFFVGPSIRAKAGRNVSFSASVLFPVYQDLNGVQQEFDLFWNAGGEVSW